MTKCVTLPVKCFDLRVLDDLVNLRTTFDVTLFSISDSELTFSLISNLTAEVLVLSAGFLSEIFLLCGAESTLVSLSDSLKSIQNSMNLTFY